MIDEAGGGYGSRLRRRWGRLAEYQGKVLAARVVGGSWDLSKAKSKSIKVELE